MTSKDYIDIGFWWMFWAWLRECWQHRPRRQQCATCEKNCWTYGTPAAVVCSEACEYEYVNF